MQRSRAVPGLPDGNAALERLGPHEAAIGRANQVAIRRLQEAKPLLVGVAPAKQALPSMGLRTVLHAGPPIDWQEMCGPMKGAVIGACMYEGWAANVDEAAHLAASGTLEFAPCHERGAVGPMAGVLTASMPVWLVENDGAGNRAYATFNEGFGKVLRHGAFGNEVLSRQLWMRDVLAPVMSATLAQLAEPIDVRALIAEALQMGDDVHNRNRAGTSLLLRRLLSGLLSADVPGSDAAAVASFISATDHFFLNLAMAAAKAAADAAASVPASSVVVTMARNGTEFGLRVSGTGDRWFTGPAGTVEGVYFSGFGPEDASRDLGDSSITETIGLGGFAMAAAPAIVRFVGGDAASTLRATRSMYQIACSESVHYRIPALDFRGTPLGIDCRKVVSTGILPIVNTGIAHREAGVGQIGAGLVRPPMEAFLTAVHGLARSLDASPV